MGSRYGRNKRREHRRIIAEQLEQIDIALKAAAIAERERRNVECELSRTMERVADWDGRIRRMLGSYTSAAINDTTFRVGSRDGIRQMQVLPRLSSRDFAMSSQISEQHTYYIENILHLLASLSDEDMVHMSRQMYFKIETPSGGRLSAAAYGISEALWHDLQAEIRDTGRPPAHFCRDIAEQVAQLLLEGDKQRRRA